MSDSILLLDIGIGAGTLPETTPAPVRYGTWFPVLHTAAPLPPVDGATLTPVADGVLLEWEPSDLPEVEYKIERAPNASGPWTEIARVKEPRCLISDPSGATWHYRITPIVRHTKNTLRCDSKVYWIITSKRISNEARLISTTTIYGTRPANPAINPGCAIQPHIVEFVISKSGSI